MAPEIFNKFYKIVDNKIDDMLTKSSSTRTNLKPKSIYVDDLAVPDQGGWREKSTIIPFDILRQIADRDMVVVAIINKLINRVASFSQPQKDRYSLGYAIRLKNREDRPKKKELKEIEYLMDYIMYTGETDNGRPPDTIKNFDTFLRLVVKDALIYNQIGIECIYDRAGKLSYFLPVSGGSIRHAIKNLGDKYSDISQLMFAPAGDPERIKQVEAQAKDLDKVKYVQVYKGQIQTFYTDKELIYRQRVPSIEIYDGGYAKGELELLINTVASHRIAEAHNEVFFKQGHAGNGILNIKTDMTDEDLMGVKRMFQRQAQGVRNAHRQIIFAVRDGVEYVPMSQMTNKDMEFSAWMDYLIKLTCAVFGINPMEINFDISRGEGAPTLSDSGYRNEAILKDTRNSALRPLLRWVQTIINDDIFPKMAGEIHKKYKFEFIGLDMEDEERELDRVKSKVTTFMTVNEIRKEYQMEELENGDIILDAVYLQHVTSQNEVPEGAPGGDGGGEMPGIEGTSDEQAGELSTILSEVTSSKASPDSLKTLSKALKKMGKNDDVIKKVISDIIKPNKDEE